MHNAIGRNVIRQIKRCCVIPSYIAGDPLAPGLIIISFSNLPVEVDGELRTKIEANIDTNGLDDRMIIEVLVNSILYMNSHMLSVTRQEET